MFSKISLFLLSLSIFMRLLKSEGRDKLIRIFLLIIIIKDFIFIQILG